MAQSSENEVSTENLIIPENALVIKPKNAQPKGFMLFFMWAFLGICIVTLPFGGIFLIWAPILALFVRPRKYKARKPKSIVFYEDRLQTYTWDNKESWSVPWEGINKVYLISHHWAFPKSIGLRLRRHDRWQASLEKSRQRRGGFWDKLHAFNTSKASVMLSRMIVKNEAVLANEHFDRPAKEFAELIFSYQHMYMLKKFNMEASPMQKARYEQLTGMTVS